MTNTNHTQPQKMSGLKKIVLGTIVGIPLAMAGTLGLLKGYEGIVLKPVQDKVEVLRKIPCESRTLEEQAFLEKNGSAWPNAFGAYTLRNHPELKNKKMSEIDSNPKYTEEYNSNYRK